MSDHTENRIVLITGAGASINLGADGKRLPLMDGWSALLVERLDAAEPGLASTIELSSALTGEEFEERVGAFLAWQSGLDLMERFVQVGRQSTAGVSGDVHQWFSNARQQAESIMRVINESLWSEFGGNRIDANVAGASYRELLRALDALPGTESGGALFSATTNYDRSGEIAFDDVGFTPDTGARGSAWQTSRLDLSTMKPWRSHTEVPHLHLHGAVGWYRDPEQGGIKIAPADQAFDDRLTPAVLYPDPDKDPLAEVDLGVAHLWGKLEEALESATHVLIVGHSLHDRPLLDAIAKASAQRRLRIGVGWFGEPDPAIQTLNSHGAFDGTKDLSLIEIDFQPDGDFTNVKRWIDGATIDREGTARGGHI